MKKNGIRCLVIISSLLYLAQQASSQVIKTVVGNHSLGGNWSYLGDDGPALSAGLSGPLGIAFDGSGNLWIADIYHSAVRQVSGGGGSGSTITSPIQNFYFTSPVGLAFDSNGYLYVADGDSSGILRFQNWSLSPDFLGQCSFTPQSLAADNSGNLYWVDEITFANGDCSGAFVPNTVSKMDSSGNINTVAGNGVQGYLGDGGSAINAQLNVDYYLNLPTYTFVTSGATVDSQGNVYIADIGNNVVRKVSSGTITTVAGNSTAGFNGDNILATSAQLNHPAAVAVDSQGNLYIADSGNHRIRRVDSGTGVITTVAGTGSSGYSGDGSSATSATLSYPGGLAFDAFGNLYISDTGNNVIRKVVFCTEAIATSSSPSIGGTTSGGGTVDCGSSVTVTATPASGYKFVTWTEGGNLVSESASYTFTADRNRTLVANFASSSATVVYVSATLPDAFEASGDPGVFTITRNTSSTASSLAVNLSFTGTATPDVDYAAIVSPVTIPAGANSVKVCIWPFQDNLAESSETAIVTINSGSGYVVGSPASSQVLIHDDTASVLADPKAAGTNTYRIYQYGPSGGRITPSSNAFTTITVTYPISGYAFVPTNGTGPFPLFFVMHGCGYDPEGFEYLCESLVSHGIIAVSVDATSISGDARTSVMLSNILQFVGWNNSSGHPLHGLVDTNRIMLAGHSCSGPAVAQAETIYNNTVAGNHIKGIVGLDAQNFYTGSSPVPNNFLMLCATRGIDQVDDPATYDKAEPINLSNPGADAPGFKALTWIVGGSHGQFSEEQVEGDPTISREDQLNTVKIYVGAMAQALLLQHPEYLKFPQDYHFAASVLPTAVKCPSEYQPLSRSFINHFDAQANPGTTPLPPYNTTAANIWNVANSSTDAGRVRTSSTAGYYGWFHWTDSSRNFQVSFSGQSLNASAYTYLALRIGQYPDNWPNVITQRLKIIVQDTSGNSASFSFSLAPTDYPLTSMPINMQTVRVPLHGLSVAGVNISQIRYITLAPDTSGGSVMFDDIQLSN